MKFTFVKQVDKPVNCYGHPDISTGDVISLEGHLAEKAKRNPNYKLVAEVSEPTKKKATKKRGNKGAA